MRHAADDPALDSLFLPLHQGLLPWPVGPVLFLRARSGAALGAARGHALICQQSFRPHAEALQRDGFDVVDTVSGEYPLVLLLPPRQRDEARALLATAVQHLMPGGVLLASASNNEGGRSIEADLRRLAGPGHGLAKNHCRTGWVQPTRESIDGDLLRDWLALDAPRDILDGRFVSRPGLFAWDRIDTASALLAEAMPADLAGRAADLGAGWGYLSDALLQRCPGIHALDLYEAESRALACARDNLRAHAPRVRLGFNWHDVTTGIASGYDVVVSNPPFHIGRADRPALGQAFIAAASAALRPGGRLLLVANRHLPYEAMLAQGFARWQVLRDARGFKVIEAVR